MAWSEHAGNKVALLYRIGSFKTINDTLGPPWVDAATSRAAPRSCVRDTDTISARASFLLH
jgi:GGDEF domain-containing protein